MREHGTADTPLMPRSQGNGLPRARIVASSAMGVAVLLLIGMETRGLMRVVDEEAAGLVREPAWPLRGLRAGSVSLLGRCLSGDCVDGEGTYLWRSGEMYEGPFKRGRMMGKGTYTWKDVPNNTTYEYVGEFDHGEMPKGCVAGDCGGYPEASRGVYVWPSGEEYVGEWRSGLMDGDGTYRWPDGETYEGEWRDGKRYGEGIATYAPGRNAAPFYDGNWEYDEPVEKYPMSVHAGH